MPAKTNNQHPLFTENSLFQPIRPDIASIIENSAPIMASQFCLGLQNIRLELFKQLLKLTFLTPKYQKLSIPLYLTIDYELKASELKQTEDCSIIKKVGFSIFKDPKFSYDFYCQESETISRWMKELSKLVFLADFSNDFKTLRYIGRGQFAKVWEVQRLNDGGKFAVKIIDKELCYGQVNGRQVVYNEIQILRKLDHQNIVHLECIYESEKSLYIVLQHIPGMVFSDLAKKKNKQSETQSSGIFEKMHNVNVMKNLLNALKYLHDIGIAHRDIKPGNVLVNPSDNWKPYIIDFGLSEITSKEEFLFQCCGSPGYMAPQIFTSMNLRDLHKCDIFSLGALFYMLLTGEPLFNGSCTEEIIQKTKQCKTVIGNKIKTLLHGAEADLLLQMLQQDPEKRISAEQALSHEFFLQASYDYLKQIRKPISEGQVTSKYTIKQRNFKSKFEELFSDTVVFMGYKLNLINEEDKQNMNTSQNTSHNMVEPSQKYIEKIQRRSSRYMSQEHIDIDLKENDPVQKIEWSGKWKNYTTLQQLFMKTNFWNVKGFNPRS